MPVTIEKKQKEVIHVLICKSHQHLAENQPLYCQRAISEITEGLSN